MKKIITILAIMIVLVGAVFADPTVAGSNASDGTAQMIIKTTVTEQFPTFALKTTNNASGSASVVANPFEAEAPENATADDALIAASGTYAVTFGIYQTTTSRTSALYSFSYTATDLVLTDLADGTHVRNVGTEVQDATEKFTINATSGVTVNTSTGFAPKAGAGNEHIIHYTGSNVAANTDVATFTVTWNKGNDQKAGDYKALITLTVAAV